MTSHVLTPVLTVAGQDSLFLCEVEKLWSRLVETLNTCRYVDSVALELTGVGARGGGASGDHDDDDYDYRALIIAV